MILEIDNPAAWLETEIQRYAATSPVNDHGMEHREKIFDQPLVGYSSGADQLYDVYREHIGNFYLTPHDIYIKSFPELEALPEELTVISWILPSTEKTRLEHAAQTKYPSERWVRTRAMGEDFNNALREHVVISLQEIGISAVAPLLAPFWSRSDQGIYAPCSNWSERHAAYAAGLGTFGLCDGLITPKGKAVRVGSVIAKINIPSSKMPYSDHHANCLYFSNGTCGECISRCPVNALSKEGHNKKRCMQYTEHTMNTYIKNKFGLDTYACGLCQCGVPCTSGIPKKE